MPTTIKQLAARLGVSHSTVSRALRDVPYVRPEVRERVRDLARALDYRPNGLARGLKGHGSRTVGLIIPDLLNDFYAQAATIIQATLIDEGYRLMLGVSGNDARTELAYLRAMHEQRVEGLIWVPRGTQREALGAFAGEGVPVIQFARTSSRRLDGVVADDRGGASAATRHLIELGHRRIGLIVGSPQLSTGRERRDGYLEALRDAGLGSDPELIRVGRFDRAWGHQATTELLKLANPPTALFATSSELMVGVLRTLQARSVRVPEHLSLVGFGDPEWFGIWTPPLTTVTFATEDMALSAVHLLLRRVRQPASERRGGGVDSRLSCRLMIRQSTARCGVSPRAPLAAIAAGRARRERKSH